MLVSYVVFNVVNVVIQTVKSIATIRCGKTVAAIVNAVAFGLYTYIVILMNSDIPLWFKITTVAVANLIGVWVVKFFEEKMEKEKLWKVETTVAASDKSDLEFTAEKMGIPFNAVDANKWAIFNFYCASKEQTALLKSVLEQFNAKYFVSETKVDTL